MSATDYGAIIERAFNGNFGGSIVERLRSSELDSKIFSINNKYGSAGVIVGVPSEKDKNSG